MQVVLFLLVGLLSVKLNQAGFLSNPQKYYDEIDSYLTTAVTSDDVEQNMAKAAEWLTELEAKGSLSTRDLVKALKEVLQLKTLVGEDKCNKEAYKLLAKSNKKARHAVRVRGSTRRIDLIVRHYAYKHTDACKHVWPQKLADKLQEVSPKSMQYASNLVKRGHIPWNYESEVKKYFELLQGYRAAADPKYPQKRYTEQWVSRDDFRKYLHDPCKEVKRKVNDELYGPIMFDITLQNRELEFYSGEYAAFQKNRAYMRWCDYIVKNVGPIWDGIFEIMRDMKRG